MVKIDICIFFSSYLMMIYMLFINQTSPNICQEFYIEPTFVYLLNCLYI